MNIKDLIQQEFLERTIEKGEEINLNKKFCKVADNFIKSLNEEQNEMFQSYKRL